MDQMTMGMFDFDQRGSSADGLKRFLKGDKGEMVIKETGV